MGNAHHTALIFPVLDRRYATGSSTISCLAIETIMLYTPFPSAWNTDPVTIQKPAKAKLKLIVRSAGTPIASIVSEASNIIKSWLGKIWNTTIPTAMIATAYIILSFMVFVSLSFLPAP